jgi:hypothetical protein
VLNESAALSGGREQCEDEEDKEVNESAALSKGRDEEEREARESAVLSESFEDGRKDEEDSGAARSDSATLYEGRGTRHDFLDDGKADGSKLAGLCGDSGECIDLP